MVNIHYVYLLQLVFLLCEQIFSTKKMLEIFSEDRQRLFTSTARIQMICIESNISTNTELTLLIFLSEQP